ncbi:uncharacterized protein A4U43_C03F1210 [Asparagus officinalis]|uniref:Beta-glucosidase n=1 Tax=Asparagus officinalis TaxID=4686 RepID=A0A5P1F6D2_ASPOF|nr:uncharacterized protein A4U43_C03F1210 [Asparagus officinalis]
MGGTSHISTGFLLHRLPKIEADEELLVSETQEFISDKTHKSSSWRRELKNGDQSQVRPPVAFALVAPFPFLPAPFDDFRDYVDLCLKSFGDRVKNWITLNEPWTNCHQGYAAGIFALGRCSPWEAGNCSAGDSG